MRKACAAKLATVLPGKKAARYLQIENKIRALLRYELEQRFPWWSRRNRATLPGGS
jgi:hypothetical protein